MFFQVLFVISTLYLVDALAKAMPVEGQDSRLRPEVLNKLIWRAVGAFVAMTVFGFASFAHGAEFSWRDTRVAGALGDDFVTPETVTEVLGVVYTQADLKKLWDELPKTRLEVGWLKRGKYILVPGPPKPMALTQVRGYDPIGNLTVVETVNPGWIAIKKEPVPGSLGKDWKIQQTLLSKNERVPSAPEVAWVSRVVYKATGRKLFQKVFVRTATRGSNGQVLVGLFSDEADEPTICECFPDGGDMVIGIAAAGKR